MFGMDRLKTLRDSSSMNDLDAFKRLYARIPRISCKGLCSRSCGVIICQETEYRAMAEVRDIPIKETPVKGLSKKEIDEGLTCPLLENDRCTVYMVRPLICRLWGVTKSMRCPHGCRPKRWLSDAEGRALLDEAKEIDHVHRSLFADIDADVRNEHKISMV